MDTVLPIARNRHLKVTERKGHRVAGVNKAQNRRAKLEHVSKAGERVCVKLELEDDAVKSRSF
jgi:hypothetical protein